MPSNCICRNYKSYRSTIKGIVAPVMSFDECVNCHPERTALNNLKNSNFEYSSTGLQDLMQKDLSYNENLTKLKNLKKRNETLLFLHVHHKLKKVIGKEYSIEDAAFEITNKNKEKYQKICMYIQEEE